MKINIGTYSFGGIASFLGLGPTLLEKFKTAASLGFDGIELLAGDLENNSVEDIKAWADAAGVEIVSVHAEPTEEIVKKLAAVGGKAVIWPMTPFCNKEEAIELAHKLDGIAAMAEPYGVRIGYHNHSQEFFVDEGKWLLEHVLDNSSKCFIQLDCGWAQNGGCYPPAFIRRYRNRVAAIHVKENSKVRGPGPRPVSAHAPAGEHPFRHLEEMSLEEKKQFLADLEARGPSEEEKERFGVQCRMGAPESNMDWQEIKNALDEQDFEAFWVVEREGFYDKRETCLAEDCAWLKEHVK